MQHQQEARFLNGKRSFENDHVPIRLRVLSHRERPDLILLHSNRHNVPA